MRTRQSRGPSRPPPARRQKGRAPREQLRAFGANSVPPKGRLGFEGPLPPPAGGLFDVPDGEKEGQGEFGRGE